MGISLQSLSNASRLMDVNLQLSKHIMNSRASEGQSPDTHICCNYVLKIDQLHVRFHIVVIQNK